MNRARRDTQAGSETHEKGAPGNSLPRTPQNLGLALAELCVITGGALLSLSLTGVTVCVLALVSIEPGTVGDILLLTRLEKDAVPVTLQIQTMHGKVRGSEAKPTAS